MKHAWGLPLVIVAALLLGAVIGFALGGRRDSASPRSLTDLDATMYAGAIASAERLHGTLATYESSLKAQLATLDSASVRESSEFVRQTYAAEKAQSLMRLADLAEKRGASAESTRLASDALAVCATSGLPYCSTGGLHQRARDADTILDNAVVRSK